MISTGGAELIRHLHNQQEITFRLLADPWRWRERVVEKLTIEDADDVAVTSSYQIRFPQDLIQDWVPEAEPGSLVRVLLPLTTRHNDVLLDVDLVGAEGQHCALLLKHQLARLQANYMAWAARSKHDANRPLEDADELLYAISAYSPAIWNRFWVQSFGRRESVLCDYLSRGLGLRVTRNQVRDWSQLVRPVEALLENSLEETVDPRSATAHLLRCLPFSENQPGDEDIVTVWLDRFVRFIYESDSATRALVAGYGQRWNVIVDTVIPVDVPTKIQLRTKRPWHDGAVPMRWPWRRAGSITQRVMVGDAQSGHAEVHLADHDVRVKAQPRVTDPEGRKIDIPRLSALRWTADKVSIYVSGRDAPAFVDLRMRLGLHKPTHWFLWLLVIATTASLPLALLVDGATPLEESTALVALPLAGAILLARPATGAAQRLQRTLRGALVVVVAVVFLVVASLLAWRSATVDDATSSTDSTAIERVGPQLVARGA